MDIESARTFCLRLKGVTESFPFDEVTLVFKVENKMFAVLPLEKIEKSITLKCDPDLSIDLRERYVAVRPAWHFNKKHWNSIDLVSDMPDKEILYWIDHSYRLAISKLAKKIRTEYEDV